MSQMIGVDVGLKSIKAIILEKNESNYLLVGIGEIANPGTDWIGSQTGGKNLEEVAKAIKTLLKDLKINTKLAATALPEHETVSRLVSLPPLKETEIRDALRFEAETFVPYPLDQVSIDYEVIEEDQAGRLSVFTIAAKNDLIANFVKIFKGAGLELIAIESPAVATKRLLQQMGVSLEATMVVDIGEKFSNIVAFRKNNIYFSRSMPVGGESLTRAISVNLGLDMASAEEYKKAYGIREMELEGKIKNAIMPVFSSMSEEIRKAMALFAENGDQKIQLLVLSGGGAKMPGMAEELTKTLGIEVQVLQPFLKIDTTKVVAPIDLNTEGYRFATATGLAMRESK